MAGLSKIDGTRAESKAITLQAIERYTYDYGYFPSFLTVVQWSSPLSFSEIAANLGWSRQRLSRYTQADRHLGQWQLAEFREAMKIKQAEFWRVYQWYYEEFFPAHAKKEH